jgi:hypothetical protein
MTDHIKPELLERIRSDGTWHGNVGSQLMMAMLGSGSRHLVGYRATGAAERLRVHDVGITVRSFASIRFPAGVSWWEWVPNGSERIVSRIPESVPDRCGMLVIADTSGQRGMMHYAEHRPLMDNHGTARPSPAAITFDINNDPRPVQSILPCGDASIYRAIVPFRVGEKTSVFDEPDPVDQGWLARQFGIVRSPLHRDDPRNSPFPDHLSEYSDDQRELLRCFNYALTVEAITLCCIMLVISAESTDRWTAYSNNTKPLKMGRHPEQAFGYEATVL